MALFAHRYYTPEPNFTGLFRLIDDFDRIASAQAVSNRSRHCRRQTPAFSPKFDVKETETAYELQGELPGLDKQNLQVEFTDAQTLAIRGKVERTFTAGTPPAAQAEDVQMTGALEEPAADADDAVVVDHEEVDSDDSSYHAATVEDAPEDDAATAETATVQETPATTTAEVAQPQEDAAKPAEDAPQEPKARYWVSERSIGSFARSFKFPARVDTDAVSATLENGVLTVTVPKAKKHEPRSISVL